MFKGIFDEFELSPNPKFKRAYAFLETGDLHIETDRELAKGNYYEFDRSLYPQVNRAMNSPDGSWNVLGTRKIRYDRSFDIEDPPNETDREDSIDSCDIHKRK